jgi:cation transport regulator
LARDNRDRRPCPIRTTRICRRRFGAHLPPHAQDIFRAAFNHAWESYGRREPARREEIALRVAWSAVKQRYRKAGEAWVPID